MNNNPNTAYLTYSNNPQDTTGKEKGETPKVTVYDWTFSLVGNKVDEKGEPLAGAKFQLRNVHGDAIRLVKIADNVYRLEIGSEAGSVDHIETDATGKFTIKGIDDQTTYKLVEIDTLLSITELIHMSSSLTQHMILLIRFSPFVCSTALIQAQAVQQLRS